MSAHAAEMAAHAATLGLPRTHFRRTDSTNERARALAAGGAAHGTLVTAAEQAAGRGRHGRVWSAPAGSSVLMSLVLREWPQLLPLAAAVAVCDVAGEGTMVKWPNDVVVPRGGTQAPLAKLAGILTEGRPTEGWLVVGIGLNVAVDVEQMPRELRGCIATMGRGPDQVETVLAALLGALARRLAEPAEQTLRAWRSRDALIGRTVAWSGGEGIARGVDPGGRLLVVSGDGAVAALDSGEVDLRT